MDSGDIVDCDWHTVFACADDDLLDVSKVLDITLAPYHVFMLAELDYAPADIIVRLANRHDHLVDRDVKSEKFVRIDFDLILVDEAA